MPRTSFDVFATSTEHLLCGMHSVKDAIGCSESADELKTLGLNFMRNNPTVALNDADQTPTMFATAQGFSSVDDYLAAQEKKNHFDGKWTRRGERGDMGARSGAWPGDQLR
jgi:hypothetical protein